MLLPHWVWKAMTPIRDEKERVDVTMSHPAFAFKPDLHLLLPSAEPLLATAYVLGAQPQAK